MTQPAIERKDEITRIPMAEVRDRVGELVDKAMGGEPQVLTRYGRDVVVIVAAKEWTRLTGVELVEREAAAPSAG